MTIFIKGSRQIFAAHIHALSKKAFDWLPIQIGRKFVHKIFSLHTVAAHSVLDTSREVYQNG